MDKEESLIGFLKGLRIAISNSLAYSRQHPYFLKSAQEFKDKIDSLFTYLDPVKVNVSPEALFLDGKYWNKLSSSVELAATLHQRKIKSIEFRSGLSVTELADCLSFLALQPKEILKKGGLTKLLKDVNSQHIRIEELDYSRLLGAHGEKAKDVWLYLFNDALDSQDPEKMDEFADNFSEGIKNISVGTVIEDDKLRGNLGKLLHYLKTSKKEKFAKCSQDLSGMFLSFEEQISPETVEKLKDVLKDLDANDFTEILSSQISNDASLNTLNLGLFSRLAGEDKADKIIASLTERIKSRASPGNKPLLAKKIRDLLSGSDASTVSPVYHAALSSLIKDISFEGSLVFDRQQLRSNYRLIILNVFSQEKEPDGLRIVLERLNSEWQAITQEKDYKFIRYLLEIVKQKKQNGELTADMAQDLDKRIAELVENDIWLEVVPEDLKYLADNLEKSHFPASFYLDKFFRENMINTHAVRLFLRFFPESLNVFYDNLRSRRTDLELLSRVIRIIAEIDEPGFHAVLKEVYFSGNELIKIEVLRAMREARAIDTEFLFSQLGSESIALKKEALRVLLRDEVARKKGISMLLDIPSPWGRKNQLIIENIKIIEDLGLTEAAGDMVLLSKRRFFWNKRLRHRALEVLKRWK